MRYILTTQKIILIGIFYITLDLQACHFTENMVCGVGGRTRTFCIQNVWYLVRRSKLQPFCNLLSYTPPNLIWLSERL